MPFEIKIDSEQFVAIENRLRDTAKEILSGSALKQEVGEFAVERIKYQTRIGAPYNTSNSLPNLKPSTVKNRKYLAKHNETHDTFDPERSNLTITGDLLESLKWSDQGDCLLKLEFVGDHKPYYGKKGQVISGDALANATLVEYLAAKGFMVFDMSLQAKDDFVSRIKTICQRYIRRGLQVRSKLGSD